MAPSGEVALRESAGPDTAATGGFVGHVLPDGKLVGSWHNAAGTVHLPFELTRVVGTDGLSNFVFKVLTGNFQVAFSHAELARFHPPQDRGRFGTMLIAARRNLS